jgi:hypothetical protein
MFRNLLEESGGLCGLVFTKHPPASRARQHQPLARSREADVAEAPLLLDLLFVLGRTGVREEAFFHAGDDDDRKFESLGGVHAHQPDVRFLRAFGFIDFGEQRQTIHKSAE